MTFSAGWRISQDLRRDSFPTITTEVITMGEAGLPIAIGTGNPDSYRETGRLAALVTQTPSIAVPI
jgi:hypothetical protein